MDTQTVAEKKRMPAKSDPPLEPKRLDKGSVLRTDLLGEPQRRPQGEPLNVRGIGVGGGGGGGVGGGGGGAGGGGGGG